MGLRGVPFSALHYWLTNIGVADGSVDVWETFAEVNVPVIAGRPGFEQLDLNAAVRHTDYSTSGPVDTWKLGMTWRTIDEMLLSATVFLDIRAPSLFNLYAGDQSTISTILDTVTMSPGEYPPSLIAILIRLLLVLSTRCKRFPV